MEQNRTFVVACSEGTKALTALNLCIDRLMKIGDKINAFHVYNEGERKINFQNSLNAILLSKVLTSQVPSCKFNLVWERKTLKHLVAQIIKFANQCQCDFLLVGFSQDDIFIATMLEKNPSNLILIKSEFHQIGPANWVLCIDNSSNYTSEKTSLLISSLMSERDNLCIVHVKESENENFQQNYIENLFPNTLVYSIESSTEYIHESILMFLDNRSITAHFLIIGAFGETAERSGKKIVGSVAKNIVKAADGVNLVILR